MSLNLINQVITIVRIELKKIYRARIIPMVIMSFTLLLLIKRGPDWQQYTSNGLMFLVALIGLVGFGTLSSWVFANEFTSQTFKDLLALPISRKTIVGGKLLAIEIAELIITACELLIMILFGLIYLHSPIPHHTLDSVIKITLTTFSYNVLLSFLWPLVSSMTKSSLIPTALSFGTLIIAVMFSGQQIGQYIPWSIPGYFMAHTQHPGVISNAIVTIVGIIGIYGTIYLWTKKDQQ
ncbi:ABC transporter permease [Lentilactobacillus kosonis]|uniref:Bacitracin ABC transporter, permease protein n=1 Tax=Lentilactobacillus kosonis TaxID=2810561 RepID=A0A401FHX7_9LACO|nr:ABC transporter permease [Lentilactobacillus kosonis]GAY71973.1 bacitracin ABC transporter, permease protein [Lentilactobacillus kosonis]